MKMIIINECPLCGDFVKQEETHEYTINKEGKRKVKYFFHSECFDKYCNNKDNDL